MAKAFRDEWLAVIHDPGALIFFLGLTLAYPVVYTLVYNPEVVRDLPVVVVDRSRTAQSRELARMCDATETMDVAYYASNLNEAKHLFYGGDAMVIIDIPEDYAQRLGRGEQAVVTVYCQMPLLLRFRQVSAALSNVQMALSQKLVGSRVALLGVSSLAGGGSVMPMLSQEHQLGDPQQGFASFVMPGIVVLILQQAMLLAICLLNGTRYERGQRVNYPVGAMLWGRALCYVVIMMAPAMWLLHYVPVLFSLPHFGSAWQWGFLVLPLTLATAMLGQMAGTLMRRREDCFLWVVVTSIVFLFISGLTWPLYAMPDALRALGSTVPATWGINAFIRINSNAATLAENATAYLWLWGLTLAYLIGAYLANKVARRNS